MRTRELNPKVRHSPMQPEAVPPIAMPGAKEAANKFAAWDNASFTTTSANEHDLNQADWYIAEQPGRLNALKQRPRINKVGIQTECLKASIRAKVEHLFWIIKCQFGFVKVRYRELKKNDGKLAMLFALANVVRVDQMLRVQG